MTRTAHLGKATYPALVLVGAALLASQAAAGAARASLHSARAPAMADATNQPAASDDRNGHHLLLGLGLGAAERIDSPASSLTHRGPAYGGLVAYRWRGTGLEGSATALGGVQQLKAWGGSPAAVQQASIQLGATLIVSEGATSAWLLGLEANADATIVDHSELGSLTFDGGVGPWLTIGIDHSTPLGLLRVQLAAPLLSYRVRSPYSGESDDTYQERFDRLASWNALWERPEAQLRLRLQRKLGTLSMFIGYLAWAHTYLEPGGTTALSQGLSAGVEL